MIAISDDEIAMADRDSKSFLIRADNANGAAVALSENIGDNLVGTKKKMRTSWMPLYTLDLTMSLVGDFGKQSALEFTDDLSICNSIIPPPNP